MGSSWYSVLLGSLSCTRVSSARAEAPTTRLSSARDLIRVRVIEHTAQPITARVITARMTEPSNPSTSTPPPFAAQPL